MKNTNFSNSGIARIPLWADDGCIRHPYADEITDVSDLVRRVERGEVVYAKSVTHTPESSGFLGLDELDVALQKRRPHKRHFLSESEKAERWVSRSEPFSTRTTGWLHPDLLPTSALQDVPELVAAFAGSEAPVRIPHDFNPSEVPKESVASLRMRLSRVIAENRALQLRIAERDDIIQRLNERPAA